MLEPESERNIIDTDDDFSGNNEFTRCLVQGDKHHHLSMNLPIVFGSLLQISASA